MCEKCAQVANQALDTYKDLCEKGFAMGDIIMLVGLLEGIAAGKEAGTRESGEHPADVLEEFEDRYLSGLELGVGLGQMLAQGGEVRAIAPEDLAAAGVDLAKMSLDSGEC